MTLPPFLYIPIPSSATFKVDVFVVVTYPLLIEYIPTDFLPVLICASLVIFTVAPSFAYIPIVELFLSESVESLTVMLPLLLNVCSAVPSKYVPTVFLPEISIFPVFSIVLAVPEAFLEYIPNDSSPDIFIEALFLKFEFTPMIPLDFCEVPSIKLPSDTKSALFPYIPTEF